MLGIKSGRLLSTSRASELGTQTGNPITFPDHFETLANSSGCSLAHSLDIFFGDVLEGNDKKEKVNDFPFVLHYDRGDLGDKGGILGYKPQDEFFAIVTGKNTTKNNPTANPTADEGVAKFLGGIDMQFGGSAPDILQVVFQAFLGSFCARRERSPL